MVVVEQASTDGTKEWITAWAEGDPQVMVVAQEHNTGFGKGCNIGAAHSFGDILVFVNNDVIVPRGWLTKLSEIFISEQWAVLGPVSDNTGEIQRVEEVWITEEDIENINKRRWQSYGSMVWRFPRVAGFCLLIRRDQFFQNEQFDLRYGIGYFEDDDLCRRVRRSGGAIGVVPGVFVAHLGSQSFARKITKPEYDGIIWHNRRAFATGALQDSLGRFAADAQLKMSYIVATRNRPALIRRSLMSILSQTYKNIEVIVVNDGGGSVGDIVRSLEDDRIVYMDEPHRGKSGALNRALGVATGDIVGYLDDDDIIYDNHAELAVGAILRTGCDFIYFDSMKVRIKDADGQLVEIDRAPFPSQELALDRMLEINFIPNLALVHQRSCLDRVGGFRELAAIEDWEMWRRLCATCEGAHIPIITSEFGERVDTSGRNGLIARNRAMYLEIERSIRHDFRSIEWNSEWCRIWASHAYARSQDAVSFVERSLDALRMNPYNFFARLDAVRGLRLLGRREKAMELLEWFVDWRQDVYIIWRWLAEVCAEMGEAERALDAGAMALLLRSSDEDAADIYHLLGLMGLRGADRASASAYLSHAIKLRDPLSMGTSQTSDSIPREKVGARLERLVKEVGWRGVPRRAVRALLQRAVSHL